MRRPRADREPPVRRVDPRRGPADSTGKSSVRYCPGGMRGSLSRRRAPKPLEKTAILPPRVGCSHAHANADPGGSRENRRFTSHGCRDTRRKRCYGVSIRVYAGRAPHRELPERTFHVQRISHREVGDQRHPHSTRHRRRPRHHRRSVHPLPARQCRLRGHDLIAIYAIAAGLVYAGLGIFSSRRAAGRASATSPSACSSSSRASSRC